MHETEERERVKKQKSVITRNITKSVKAVRGFVGGAEFARKGGGNCKERNVQGKAPQFASV